MPITPLRQVVWSAIPGSHELVMTRAAVEGLEPVRVARSKSRIDAQVDGAETRASTSAQAAILLCSFHYAQPSVVLLYVDEPALV